MLDLSIYLTKKKNSKNSLDSYLKPEYFKKASVHYVDRNYLLNSENIKGKIYVYEDKNPPLSWENVVNKLAKSKKKIIRKRPGKTKVAILLEVQNRVFLLSFNHGVTLLKEDYLENDFGLKINRKILNNKEIKSIKSVSLSEGIISNHRFSKKNIPTELQLDRTQLNIVNDLKGTVKNEVISSLNIISSGQNNLQVRVKEDKFLKKLVPFLEKTLDIYLDNEAYKDNFHWENEIKRENNTDVIKKLEKRLAEKINKMIKAIDTSPDKGISGSTLINIQFYPNLPYSDETQILGLSISGIGYPGDFILKEIDEAEIFTRLARFLKEKKEDGWPEEDLINKLKRDNVYYFSEDNERIYLEKFYSSLYFQTNLPQMAKSRHILFQGYWYEVPNDLYSYIEKTINDISSDTSGVNYIDFAKHHSRTHSNQQVVRSEGEYNNDLANKANLVLFDQKNYYLKPEHVKRYNLVPGSKVEPCDVLDYQDDMIQMIHVKIGRNGNGVSHLLNQAHVSSILLQKDSEFIEHIRKEIEKNIGEDIESDFISDRKIIIVLACIVEPEYITKKNSNTFPLLTAAGIINTVLSIRDLGFECRLIKIPDKY